MIALTPKPLHALKKSTAPYMLPWSVKAKAGILHSAAFSAKASTDADESRMEYCE
jgi:hypothetical protein